MDIGKQLARGQDISIKASLVFAKRTKIAQQHFAQRVRQAIGDNGLTDAGKPVAPWTAWSGWYDYFVDLTQRSVLFWDTMRQRGNAFVEHTAEGLRPVLHFKYEIVLDARKFA
ncbi:MAG TPA: DUF3141 domain-containing protein, partial [Casimicrobiaceae bacterium]